MKLATVPISGAKCTVLVEDVDYQAHTMSGRVADRRSIGDLLRGNATGLRPAVESGLRRDGDPITVSLDELSPVVRRPEKIFCVGLNYREHVEMGHPVPDHPTLFVKYPSAVTSPYAEVTVPPPCRRRPTTRASWRWSSAPGSLADATTSPPRRRVRRSPAMR